jgi:hypothetical protein
MVKVKTFTSELKPFHARQELDSLDDQVNAFLRDAGVPRVASVSDTCTTMEGGATMGIIRVVAYETA